MKEIFFQILDMSVTASWLVLVVIAVRFVLKKAPKYIHCILWAMVALRLICPALPESEASLMPSNTPVSSMVHVETQSEPVTNELPLATFPQILIEQMEEQEPQIRWVDILCAVWLVGVATMAGYGAISYLLLRRRVAPSVQQDGVWLCDDVASPFILGVFRPRIYLPSSLDEDCRKSVLAHEKAHLRRKDHWWKPLGFVLLTIHWFNPIMWLAYILLCRDIEAACDERVVKGMEPEERKRYSEALLSCAMPRRSIAACPLAFGEQGIKGRIKYVLNYKKPTIWIILVAVVASGVLAVCLLTNPPEDQKGGEIVYSTPANSKKVVTTSLDDLKNKAPELFELNAETGFEIFVWEEQKTIWCGIMEHTDDPKTQEEVDGLTAVSMRNMETILRQYRSTETNLHIIGRFGSLEESGGEDIPPKAIEMWLKDQWGLGWFDMFSSGVLAFNDITGPGDRTYCATGETVDEDQLGLLLAEGVVTPSCLFEENMDRAKYDVYTIQGKDATYLAAGLVCEDMVFEIYQLKEPVAKEPSETEPYSDLQYVMNMKIEYTLPSCPAFETDCFYAADEDACLYRVYWSDMGGLSEGQSIRVTYSSDSKKKLEYPDGYPDGGYTPKYEITAVAVEGAPLEPSVLDDATLRAIADTAVMKKFALTNLDHYEISLSRHEIDGTASVNYRLYLFGYRTSDFYNVFLNEDGSIIDISGDYSEYARYLPYATEEAFAAAKAKMDARAAGGSDYYLDIDSEGYLCLCREVIHYIDPPAGEDGTVMSGCGVDHQHLFFCERICHYT